MTGATSRGVIPRTPGESTEAYAKRVTDLFDRRVAEEMAAETAVKPAWRKVALLWAADKGWPLFVSLGSAAAFACGAPTLGYGLLIGWAIGTVLG